MENRPLTKKEKSNFTLKVAIIAIAAIIVMYFSHVLNIFGYLLNVLIPIIIGLGIAYIWNLILTPIEKKLFGRSNKPIIKKIKRPLSILISFLIMVLIITVLLYLVIPQIYDSISIITEALPQQAQRLSDWFLNVTDGIDWAEEYRNRIQNANLNWQDILSKVMEFVRNSLGGFLGSTFAVLNSIFGLIFTTFTTIILSIYILSSKERLKSQISRTSKAYMKPKHRNRAIYFLEVLDEKFSNFFKGELIDITAIGILLFLAMTIFGLPYAITISVVVAATALIPMIGAFIGGIIGFLMISVTDFKQAILFVVILLVVQQLEGNLIYPKIVGDSVALPNVWVFIAVIIGGALAGPLGMIIGVPLSAALYTILKNDVNKKLAEKTNQ